MNPDPNDYTAVVSQFATAVHAFLPVMVALLSLWLGPGILFKLVRHMVDPPVLPSRSSVSRPLVPAAGPVPAPPSAEELARLGAEREFDSEWTFDGRLRHVEEVLEIEQKNGASGRRPGCLVSSGSEKRRRKIRV